MEREPNWPKIRGFLLWIISFAVGVMALFAAHETIRIVATLVLPVEPGETVAWGGQIMFISIFSLIALGVVWLVWYIALIERYTKARSAVVLARQFGITTLIQAAIFGAYGLANWILL
jgi:hypothetical protein